MYNNFNLSAFIKNRRLELNMTVRELADKIGVSGATISKWEKANIKHLREDRLIPLANALNVHPLALMGYKDISVTKGYSTNDIHRIPMYSKSPIENFFENENILKYISTDIKADFAITATQSHEDVIKPHDVLLFERSFGVDMHNKYALMVDESSDQPPFIDKLVVVHDKLFRFDKTRYTVIPDSIKVIGILVEIRRLV